MINWLISKTSTLLYAFIIFSALFYYFGFQSSFYELDSLSQQTNNLAKLTESIAASSHPLETKTKLKHVEKLKVRSRNNHHYLTLYANQKNITKEIPPVQETEITDPEKIKLIKKDKIRLEKWN